METIDIWFLLFRQSAKHLMIVIVIMTFVVFEEGDRAPYFKLGLLRKIILPYSPPLLPPYPKNIKKKYQITLNNK